MPDDFFGATQADGDPKYVNNEEIIVIDKQVFEKKIYARLKE